MTQRTTGRVSKRVRTHRKAGCAASERSVLIPTNSLTAEIQRLCEFTLGEPESRQGNSPAMDHLLRVVLATAFRFGIENELPCAIREDSHDGEIIATETGGRFEFIAVLVRSLHAHLVEGDVTVLRLGDVRKDAGGNATQANDMNWLHGVFRGSHRELGN